MTSYKDLRIELDQMRADIDALTAAANAEATEVERLRQQSNALLAASDKIGAWLAAAFDDLDTCDEFKADITAWFAAIKLAEGK